MAVGKGGSLAVVTLVQPHGQQGGSQAAKGSASTMLSMSSPAMQDLQKRSRGVPHPMGMGQR